MTVVLCPTSWSALGSSDIRIFVPIRYRVLLITLKKIPVSVLTTMPKMYRTSTNMQHGMLGCYRTSLVGTNSSKYKQRAAPRGNPVQICGWNWRQLLAKFSYVPQSMLQGTVQSFCLSNQRTIFLTSCSTYLRLPEKLVALVGYVLILPKQS